MTNILPLAAPYRAMSSSTNYFVYYVIVIRFEEKN